MSCSGNLIWDVNKRLIGYNEPNTIRTNYLGKNKTSHLNAKRIAGHAKNKDCCFSIDCPLRFACAALIRWPDLNKINIKCHYVTYQQQ